MEVTINKPISFNLATSKANNKLLIVFLRMILNEHGKNVCTFNQIANLMGYSDRRNINNFWREFELSGFDILDFLNRKVALIPCISLLENFVSENIILPLNMMYTKFIEEHKISMSLKDSTEKSKKSCPEDTASNQYKLPENYCGRSG